ncbi:TPA: DEAD/DEAH box helicase family protein [Clostridioides difficile]|uniref:DEAD/DEAH box helicase family protein n=3 Tax=Clostridioides difficile TaxID=1496 RepID=UPI00097FEFAD|nr:DEAD/DEAH box helicase family protein [Clostridioides difficile]EJX2707590.1 DEAD/DEAH box helicase family protein [Clostridioides difficile]ELX4543262.1 DEAD/DEAH box helicase family protein [Clostridioides difficile]MBH7133237.1 DEAD/DEAH box helicase family protein [Clostridioides difficile]MBH8061293.1 DEAD/DEAH box helicase family protein [Clostridioides difficile]MBY1265958.1 DEAD/DEAH box helicase family protein [Clostridioides difficile]
MKKQFVGDFFTLEKLQELKKGVNYTIYGSTGTGKSLFIREILVPYAIKENKTILILMHRTELREQFEKELHISLIKNYAETNCNWIMEHLVKVKCYQSTDVNELYCFDYIICDEFHYLMSDSWNKITNVMLEELNSIKDSIKIFLSATQNNVIKLLNAPIELCSLKKDIKVKSVEKTRSDVYLEHIHHCSTKGKVLNISSLEDAKNNYDISVIKGLDTSLLCSRSRSEYKQYNSELVSRLLINEAKFNGDILFSTTCISTGIDIKDKNFKFIGIEQLLPKESIIQLVGRKRIKYEVNNKLIHDNPPVVIVKDFNKKIIEGRIRILKEQLEEYEFYSVSKESFLKSRRDRNYIPTWLELTHNEELVVNYTIIEELKNFLIWLEEVKEYGYPESIAKLLKGRLFDIQSIKCEKELFKSFVNKELDKDAQNLLKDMLKKKYGFTGKTIGINSINGFFKDNRIEYIIKSKRVRDKSRNNNKKDNRRTIWIISEHKE